MTLRNPPLDMQNRTDHTAENDRLGIAMLLGTVGVTTWATLQGGVRWTDGTDLKVTQNGTPNMSVNVAAGVAIVPGTESATQGGYTAVNDGTVNLAIATSNPSLPRLDGVYIQIRDAFYSGANNDGNLVVVTGTPNASPVLATPPANCLLLASVAVAAAASTVVTANITDKRQAVASSGSSIIITTSSLRPVSAFTGQYLFETDTKQLKYWNGSTWVRQTPLIDAGSMPTFICDNTTRTGPTFNFTFPSAPQVFISPGLLTGNTVAAASVASTSTTTFTYRGVIFSGGTAVSTSGSSFAANYFAVLAP